MTKHIDTKELSKHELRSEFLSGLPNSSIDPAKILKCQSSTPSSVAEQNGCGKAFSSALSAFVTKLRIHGNSIEKVGDAFLVFEKGEEIGYFHSRLHAAAYAILCDLGKKPRAQREQIQRVAKALEELLQPPCKKFSSPMTSEGTVPEHVRICTRK